MRKVVPAVNPDAYVEALDGWQRKIVEVLRSAVRATSALVWIFAPKCWAARVIACGRLLMPPRTNPDVRNASFDSPSW